MENDFFNFGSAKNMGDEIAVIKRARDCRATESKTMQNCRARTRLPEIQQSSDRNPVKQQSSESEIHYQDTVIEPVKSL